MDNDELKIRSIFAEIAKQPLEVSPYLKTRVLAELRERKQRTRKLSFWRALALSFVGIAAVVIVVLTALHSPLKASAGVPIAVRFEIEELKSQQVAFAEVELPEAVAFYSETRPELREQRRLVLSLAQNTELKQLPFVIESKVRGVKEIRVKLFNDRNVLVGERTVKIKFI